jgi:hypothetical protein
MQKIPTLFRRDETFKVIDQLNPVCSWVLAGQGIATEKLDGTNVRLTIRSGQCVRAEKRRNPTKVQKQLGIVDPWYVDVDPYDKSDRWIGEAVAHASCLGVWPDGEHCAEVIGPKIQGNPLGLQEHVCVLFNLDPTLCLGSVDRSYNGLRRTLATLDSVYSPGHLAEGIVFHHPDGRRAKIKRKDFPK